MASSTCSNSQPKPRPVAIGSAILIFVVLSAVVIGIPFLPQPCYAIGQVLIYAGLVALVAGQLRTCLRLGQGTEYLSKVHYIVLLVVLGVLGVLTVVADLGRLLSTEDRDFITLPMNVWVYLALLFALRLVEQLLKQGTAHAPSGSDADSRAATSPPNQPLQQTGPA